MHKPDSFKVGLDSSLREVISVINRGAKGIALVMDDEQRLIATLTDGDIRRAVLAEVDLATSVGELLDLDRVPDRDGPITATVESSREAQLRLMRDRKIRQLPLLCRQGRVVDLLFLDDEPSDQAFPAQAVIMAGGFGSRLRPLTDQTPKPMLPIDGRPLMERTIERMREAGIHRINVTTHYLPEKITGHFGDGCRFGVDLRYVPEDQPLGTAGSLRLLDVDDEPLLVMNGDILLTRLDFRDLMKFHRQRNAELTLAVRQYDIEVPYGVVEAKDGIVTQLREKPKLNFLVNAGIYLVERSALEFIPSKQRYDMTELIETMVAQQRVVATFPIVEYWLDIGKHDDFEQAQQDVRQMRWAA